MFNLVMKSVHDRANKKGIWEQCQLKIILLLLILSRIF